MLIMLMHAAAVHMQGTCTHLKGLHTISHRCQLAIGLILPGLHKATARLTAPGSAFGQEHHALAGDVMVKHATQG